MKILLFGSSGMIGTAIEKVCDEKGVQLAGMNHSDIDVTEKGAVESAVKKINPTVVINCVAVIGVNPCEQDPLGAFNLNAISTSYMAKACEKKGIVFVQPSSHAVFDGTKDDYYTEYDPPVPISMYSVSKYIAELFAINICSRHYVLRLPTMFGPRRNKKPGFVDKVVEKIENGESLKIAVDKTDSPTYSIDAAERMISMLMNDFPYGVYHLANEGITTYYLFIKKLVELIGADVKLETAKDSDFPALAHKPLKTAMKSAKLKPMRPWDDALADYVTILKGERKPER